MERVQEEAAIEAILFTMGESVELEKIADQRMYRDKSIYYETHGIEKRR